MKDFHCIHCTGQHLFWIEEENKWVKAIDLKPEMSLFELEKVNKRKSKVRRIVIVNKRVETYNIEVEKYHNYFISSKVQSMILTHNASKQSLYASTVTQRYYFYKILDYSDNVIYVGQTRQSIKQRENQHKNDPRKAKWRNLIMNGKEINSIKQLMTPYEAAVWETYYIGESGYIVKNNNKSLLKNKQIPIGKKKFEKFKDVGFNPCKLF